MRHLNQPQGPRREMAESLSDEAKAFISGMDRPGASLAVFDEGKGFFMLRPLFQQLFSFVLTETEHVVLRVGGYSFRAEGMALETAHSLHSDPGRVMDFRCHGAALPSGIATVVDMHAFDFDYGSEFIRQAERYDYKCFSMGGHAHPMVYYYVKGIVTGFHDGDGAFFPFYSKDRGLQAIADAMRVLGYGGIPAATAAVYTDYFRTKGNSMYIGDAAHYDLRACSESQRGLFQDAGIPYLDIGTARP